MKIVKLSLVLVAALLAACGGQKQKSAEEAFMESLDTTKAEGPSISEEVIGDILQSIHAPLEI